MKQKLVLLFTALFITFGAFAQSKPKIYIAFHWHMHQPIYWPGENVIETINNDRMSYDLLGVFTSRTGPYTTYPTGAVNKFVTAGIPGGAQVSLSGSLIENLNLIEKNTSHFKNWKSSWVDMINKKTDQGNQRLDMVAFGYHHPLMALTDYEDIRKQIQMHKQIFADNFPGYTYSKGIFPPENAFEVTMIPALVDEGIEWAFVDNSHFDRTCIGLPYEKGFSIVEPNKADVINPDPQDWLKLDGLYAPGKISAGFGHRPHWMKYVDPENGTEKKMIAVPTSLLFGNEDGRGGFGALQYDKCLSQLEPYNTDPNHPILVVMHHDGDNHGGGSAGYYTSNFDNMIAWLQENPDRFECITVDDYLEKFPPADDDIIHVESGSWYGAGADPEFLKWNGDPGKYSLYPSDDVLAENYSPDRNSWSIITAAANVVKTADNINPNSPDTKAGWDYLTVGETSCYWYWDGTESWDSHAARASNLAVAAAMKVVDTGADKIGPSVYHLQRQDYNPGEVEWVTYQKPSDFTVWTYVYDVSGLLSVKLKYREDKDGVRNLRSNQNDTYAGGDEVGEWVSIDMTPNSYSSITNPLPTYKADEYSAMIEGVKDKLLDYYVEAVDTKGNITRTPIYHVWVGDNEGGIDPIDPTDPDVKTILPSNIIMTPAEPAYGDEITLTITDNRWVSGTVLHLGENGWKNVTDPAFVLDANGKYSVKIGPYNDESVKYLKFCVNYNGSWDNNGGSDYKIALKAVQTDMPTGKDFTKTIDEGASYTFTTADFGFNSSLGNAFAGIRIASLPASGTLKNNGTSVAVNTVVADVTRLVYTPNSSVTGSFTFRLIDSQGQESERVYTATIKVASLNQGITVRFKKPSSWSTVTVWAWDSSKNYSGGKWPGAAATQEEDGWYAFALDPEVTSVNVIISDNGSNQTHDIEGVTASTCYELGSSSNGKYNVNIVDCPQGTSIEDPAEQKPEIAIYPIPMGEKAFIRLSDTKSVDTYTVEIYSMMASLVQRFSFTGDFAEISRDGMSSGMYFVRIFDSKGEEILMQRIIVK